MRKGQAYKRMKLYYRNVYIKSSKEEQKGKKKFKDTHILESIICLFFRV